MSVTKIGGAIAAILIAGTMASAQSANQTMTVTGCIVHESDYRKTHNLGKGALGGVGLGDEYVIVEGSCSDTNAKAYRLTGKPEHELKPFVGHRLEVTGTWDHERDAKIAAGQVKAKLPPEIKIASYREAQTAEVTPAPAAPAQAAPAPAPEQTVASNETHRRLPKTASNEPLIALIGLAALSAALVARVFRFGVL